MEKAYQPVPYAGQGGYLPVEKVTTRGELQTGFRGIFSLEVFDSGTQDGKDVYLNDFAQEDMPVFQKLFLARSRG